MVGGNKVEGPKRFWSGAEWEQMSLEAVACAPIDSGGHRDLTQSASDSRWSSPSPVFYDGKWK